MSAYMATLAIAGLLFVSKIANADRAAAYYHQAMALKKAGKNTEAIAALKKALSSRPDYVAAHHSLGMLYRNEGNYARSLEHLKRATALSPDAAEIHHTLGLTYHRAGKKKEAIAALSRAAALKPKRAEMRAQYGIILIRVAPQKAVRELRAAVDLSDESDPKSGSYAHHLALAHRRVADQLRRRQAQLPKAGGQRSKLARLEKEHLAAAARNFDRALALDESAALHFDVGVYYRRLNKLKKAEYHYQRAVELDPKAADAWWDLGHVYTRLERTEEAVEAYEHYLSLKKGRGKKEALVQQRIKDLRKHQAVKP